MYCWPAWPPETVNTTLVPTTLGVPMVRGGVVAGVAVMVGDPVSWSVPPWSGSSSGCLLNSNAYLRSSPDRWILASDGMGDTVPKKVGGLSCWGCCPPLTRRRRDVDVMDRHAHLPCRRAGRGVRGDPNFL